MPKEHVNPGTLFSSLPHGFSQVVVASGKRMAFISGQTAWDAQKRTIGGASLLEQARQALRNVQAAVVAAGGTLKDVVALRIYIVNYQPESARPVASALREFFVEERPPASTWIGVSALAVPDFLIEIEATAVLDYSVHRFRVRLTRRVVEANLLSRHELRSSSQDAHIPLPLPVLRA